jgi:uncharacterized cofD-like protein
MKKTKLVTIGGGSGQYNMLSGLRDLKKIDITSIVSMVDSGGSTGRLRDEFGVLPPGDALKCILALSPNREYARKILLTRFNKDNRLKGHNAGNMLVAMLAQYAGNFPDGINALGEILNIRGRVLPVTTDRATLAAELTDGRHLYGESTIDLPRGDQRAKIRKTFLVPHHGDSVKVHPPVLEAIGEADYIIIGPGDLYTSIIPNFLVPGVVEAARKAKGKLVYVVNIMTKFGETDNFKVSDFVREMEKRLRRRLDHILVNDGKISKDMVKRYKGQKAELVRNDLRPGNGGRDQVVVDLISTKGQIARHDADKLAAAIARLINQKIMITVTDLDYTLLDAARFKRECLAPFFGMTAEAWEEQYQRNFKKPGINYSPRKQFELHGLPESEIARRLADLRKRLKQDIGKFLFPEAEEMLAFLKGRSEELILASFGDLEWQGMKIDSLHVNKEAAAQYFSRIILEDKDKTENGTIRSLRGKEVLLVNDNYRESRKLLEALGGSAKLYLVKGPYSENRREAHAGLSEIGQAFRRERTREIRPFAGLAGSIR